LSHESLDRLVDRIGEGKVPADILVELAPFLGRQTLAKVMHLVALGTLDAHTIVELAPFLDRETLEALIRGVYKPEAKS